MKTVRLVIALSSMVVLLPACASPDWQRVAHELLQQASCEQSEPRGSCHRNWEDEYRAWKSQHSAFLKALKDEHKPTETAEWLQPVDVASLPLL